MKLQLSNDQAPTIVGLAPPQHHGMVLERDGDITFFAKGVELLRITKDGRFLREGREIGVDSEIPVAFRGWLVGLGVLQP